MAAEPPVSRTYDSSGRQAQAAENRTRILRTATALFIANGFAGTTIAAVAREARVSAPTVYAGFDSKAALLQKCIDVALAGDDRPVAVADRPLAQWATDTDDPRELLGRFAVMMGEVSRRAASIYDVLVRAADADPDLAALLADLEQQRLRAASRVAEGVRDRDGLPEGRTVREARDVVWMLLAPELYVTLTRKRRWSTRQYVSWARDTLVKLVIEPPAVGDVPVPP
jgi:AcrR family transcriptional regulator